MNESQKNWIINHPNYHKNYYKANAEKEKARTMAWRKTHIKEVAAHGRKTLLKKNGMTVEEYDKLFKIQKGCCLICNKPETRLFNKKVSKLAIDHNHSCCPGRFSCGKCIRGLLCYKCNQVLALVNDDKKLLKNAINYLENKGGIV